MKDRVSVLNSLLKLDRSIKSIKKDLSEFEWDSDILVTLQTVHIRSIIERYLSGQIDESTVEAWANIIECRDDIEIPKEINDPVEEIIYELANPYLTQNLTYEGAKILLQNLELGAAH